MTNDEHKPQLACMLVELDSLLDTRLGTIAKFGREAYVKALMGGYYFRTSDHFEGIDPKEFRRLYRERDAVTLSLSVMTHATTLIKDFVGRVNAVAATAPIQKVPRIDINVYPYDPPERVTKMIEKAIRAIVNDRFDIGFVRYSPEDLHYDLVKFTYDHLIMYRIGDWIEAQAVDWEKRNRGLPDTTVFMPALFMGDNKEDVPEDMAVASDDVTRALSPVINAMQVPVRMFCSVMDPMMLTPGSPGAEAPRDESVSQEVSR